MQHHQQQRPNRATTAPVLSERTGAGMTKKRKHWVMFTKRTNDPKLKWLEEELAKHGIESRRNGESWHAPILEVQLKDWTRADAILAPVDDIADDAPQFMLDDFPMLEWLNENKDNQ